MVDQITSQMGNILHKSSKPLLTIGIPTWNRKNILSHLVDWLVAEIQREHISEEDVEILVSDNCSDDGTYEYLQLMGNRHPNLFSYHRNESNIGFDANVNRLFDVANGLFVWTMGDDDVVNDGVISDILSVIRSQIDIGVIFLNYGVYRNDYALFDSVSSCRASKNTIIENGDDYFQITSLANTCISSNIFNAKLWRDTEAERYIGTGYIHTCMAAEIAIKAKSYIFSDIKVRTNYVSLRESRKYAYEDTGMPLYFLDVAFRLNDYVLSLKDIGYSDETVQSGGRLCLKEVLWQVLVFKRMALKYSFVNISKYSWKIIYRFYDSLLMWVVILPLLYAPNIVVRLMYRGYKIAKAKIAQNELKAAS